MLYARRYEVVETLGRGAGGEVHLVRDIFSPGRLLALKTLRGDEEQLVTALRREFQVLAALRHPQLAQVFDFGRIGADEPGGPATFMTREYLDGESLADAAAGAELETVIALVAGLCRALAPLHQSGLIHGDLKPDNVIVGADGEARLIDFGLARPEGVAEGPPTGTLPYIAPEVIQGQASDPRSDLYSLGALLYELLTGAPPFRGTTSDVVKAHLQREPPPLVFDARFAGAPEAARAALAGVVARLLSKSPSDRYPGVGELRAALASAAPAAAVAEDEAAIAVLPGLLGRESSLSALEDALRGAGRGDGAPSLVAVRGGPGAGKTTLLRELKWRAQLAGVQVVEAPCDASPSPTRPLNELARRLELLTGDEPPASMQSGDAEQLAARAAVAARAASRRAPLLVLIEDLHLASAEAGAAIRSFAHDDMAGGAMLVVVSLCPEAAPAEVGAFLGDAAVVDLRPLRQAEVARLTASILGSGDAELAERVHQWTGGNPLFCIEVLRAVRARGGVSASELEGLGVPRRLEEHWAGRARSAGELGRQVLAAVAALGRPVDRSLLAAAAGLDGSSFDEAVGGLVREGLVTVLGSGDVALAHQGLADSAAELLDEEARRGLHGRAAEVLERERAPRAEIAHHLLRAGEPGRAKGCRLALDAARELIRSGASRAAAELMREAVSRWSGRDVAEARLLLAEACHGAGEYDEAAAVIDEALPRLDGDADRARALSLLGRVRTGRGDFDGAAEAWQGALELLDDPVQRARVRRDLGRMYLKRGDYARAEETTRAALEEVGPEDSLRADLFCTLGIVADYRGDGAEALSRYEDALELARASGARRAEATAHTYKAIAYQREGDYARAFEAYTRGLALVREEGDVGRMAVLHGNLGGLAHSSNEPVRALDHYRQALRLAQRSGREATAVAARTNLGLLHLHLGEFESARRALERALSAAERLGTKQMAAQATAHLGELALRQEKHDEAVDRYFEAMNRYRGVGMTAEATEVALDLVFALIERGRTSDLREAAERLDAVRERLTEQGLERLVGRSDLAMARLAAARGEEERSLSMAERAARRAQASGDLEVEWEALVEAAEILLRRGAPLAAKGKVERAVEILEEVAATLPRELRKSYWQDRRRQRARRLLEEALAEAATPALVNGARDGSMTEMLFRLLEINKRINSDPDLPKLLERIMDSAIELTDAERGFLLLVNDDGELEMTTARDFDQGTPDDAHLQFSRSIAETVLIDGEPVITVNAMDDHRFNEYLSVHQLKLQSVLCIPIRARGRTIGVLYMEHRLRHGGFGEPDQRILLAFADQVAIALENSRLMAQLSRRTQELETAKAEIEKLYEERGELLNQRTAQLAAAQSDLERAMDQIRGRVGFQGIVGQSEPMLRVFAILDRVRKADVPVVITGDSGTGKEMVARAIHDGGPRSKKPFVAINCGAIPETLLESELFGHVRGSFTGADRDKKGLLLSAHGGTVFLDEIGDMPLKMQLDLLRVLQEKKIRPLGSERDIEIDVRVLAASNRPLRDLIDRGTFREDLYYRLSVVEISLPPLRERADDVPLLVDHFLNQIAARFSTEKRGVSREALRALMAYPWPGNVRQLEHVLMNACVMCDGQTIDVVDLTLEPVAVRDCAEPRQISRLPSTARDRREMEKQRILEALEQTGWNKSKAAKVLGMPRRTLYRRLKAYGILSGTSARCGCEDHRR